MSRRTITAPRLVVGDAGWAHDLPDWLLDEIKAERLVECMIGALHPEKLREKVGDAEIAAYLMTASLRAPLPYYLVEVYVWVMARLCSRRKMEITDFMQEKLRTGLARDEERELEELRRHLWTARGGEIRHPLIEALKELRDHPPSPQLDLEGIPTNDGDIDRPKPIRRETVPKTTQVPVEQGSRSLFSLELP
jgi:hypothetical protein